MALLQKRSTFLSSADLVDLLNHLTKLNNPTTSLLSKLSDGITTQKLQLEDVLTCWPDKDSKLELAKQILNQSNLLDTNRDFLNLAVQDSTKYSSSLEECNHQMFNHYLNILQSSFKIWLQNSSFKAVSTDKSSILEQFRVLDQFLSLTVLQLMSWIHPNARLAEIIFTENIFPQANFELLLSFIDLCFSHPSSLFLINIARIIKPDKLFDIDVELAIQSLLTVSRFETSQYLFQSIAPIWKSYYYLYRPSLYYEYGSLVDSEHLKQPLSLSGLFLIKTSRSISDNSQSYIESIWINNILYEMMNGMYLNCWDLDTAAKHIWNIKSILDLSSSDLYSQILSYFTKQEFMSPKGSLQWIKARTAIINIFPKLLKYFELLSRQSIIQDSSNYYSVLNSNIHNHEQDILVIINWYSEYRIVLASQFENWENSNNSTELVTELLEKLHQYGLFQIDSFSAFVCNDVFLSRIEPHFGNLANWNQHSQNKPIFDYSTFSYPSSSPSSSSSSSFPSSHELSQLKSKIESSNDPNEVSASLDQIFNLFLEKPFFQDQILSIIFEVLNNYPNTLFGIDGQEQELLSTRFSMIFDRLSSPIVLDLLLLQVNFFDLCKILIHELILNGCLFTHEAFSRFSSAFFLLLQIFAKTNIKTCHRTKSHFIRQLQIYLSTRYKNIFNPEHIGNYSSFDRQVKSDQQVKSDLNADDSTSSLFSILSPIFSSTETHHFSSKFNFYDFTILDFIADYFDSYSNSWRVVGNFDKIMEMVYHQATVTEISSDSCPWMLVSNIGNVISSCARLTTVVGPNGERPQLVEPMIDGILNLTKCAPFLAPLILDYLARQLTIGEVDQQGIIQNYILPFVLDEFVQIWLYPTQEDLVSDEFGQLVYENKAPGNKVALKEPNRSITTIHIKDTIYNLVQTRPEMLEKQNVKKLFLAIKEEFGMEDLSSFGSGEESLASSYNLHKIIEHYLENPNDHPKKLITFFDSIGNDNILTTCQQIMQIFCSLLKTQTDSTRLSIESVLQLIIHVLSFNARSDFVSTFFDIVFATMLKNQTSSQESQCLVKFAISFIQNSQIILVSEEMISHDQYQLLFSIKRFYSVLLEMMESVPAEVENLESSPNQYPSTSQMINWMSIPISFFQIGSFIPGMLTLFEDMVPQLMSMMTKWKSELYAIQGLFTSPDIHHSRYQDSRHLKETSDQSYQSDQSHQSHQSYQSDLLDWKLIKLWRIVSSSKRDFERIFPANDNAAENYESNKSVSTTILNSKYFEIDDIEEHKVVDIFCLNE